ncbi:transporter [Photobacterium jeanii]|uniref:Transporter n=1 Tax=Photobacterium jeanii TaxID=858640 RepID=A0A178K8R1_9GAMM|nr:ACT domain-containing protein [Photobacterium jeanii]OAN13053.1 transporter [Photobacterium jeanii]PST89202.1 ACT domain-containing protein [Photobacterium jeanii]
MAGITSLTQLLKSMSPAINDGEFVFCTMQGKLADYLHLNPLASFNESEGLTLILEKEIASQEGFFFEGSYKQITLTVHSSLEAVGLTAAVANALADQGISANVVAAYFHDHIFVQADKAQAALEALKTLSQDQQ